MSDLITSAVETVPWELVGAILATHVALTGFFYLLVGSRRNAAAVMGGSDSDNVKADAKVERGTILCTMLAYNILAIGYASFCAYTGTTAWFDGRAEAVSSSLHDRFYAYSEPYAQIAKLTIAYELYNTLAVIFIKEYRNAPFIGHHACCLILGIMSTYPFCHYYATFFFGLTAISSVPLALIELAQAAELPTMVEVARGLFCVCFLVFRTVYWPIESYKYWTDALAALNGAVPVHNHAAHYFLLLSNVGLTGLQFFWTSLIIKGIAEKVAPAESHAKAA